MPKLKKNFKILLFYVVHTMHIMHTEFIPFIQLKFLYQFFKKLFLSIFLNFPGFFSFFFFKVSNEIYLNNWDTLNIYNFGEFPGMSNLKNASQLKGGFEMILCFPQLHSFIGLWVGSSTQSDSECTSLLTQVYRNVEHGLHDLLLQLQII